MKIEMEGSTQSAYGAKLTSFVLASDRLLATGVVVTDDGAERRSSESEYGSESRLLFRSAESAFVCRAESVEFNFRLDFGDVGLQDEKCTVQLKVQTQ